MRRDRTVPITVPLESMAILAHVLSMDSSLQEMCKNEPWLRGESFTNDIKYDVLNNV